MNEPTSVTYSIAEVLKRIEDKVDKQQEITATTIKRLEDKIDSNQKEVNQKLDKQSEEITTIKATLQAQQPLIQKIPDLAEKVGELKNWRQIFIIALTALISGSITWVVRGGNLKP